MSVSFPEVSSRSKGALGLIADPGLTPAQVEDIFAAHKEEILAVANMMHLTIVHLPQLSRHRALSPRQRDYIDKVQRSGRHLLGLINDILDFSKIEAGKLDIEAIDFGLHEVLDNVASLVAVTP